MPEICTVEPRLDNRHHDDACTKTRMRTDGKTSALRVHTSWILEGQITTADLEDCDLAAFVDSFTATQRASPAATLTVWLHQRMAETAAGHTSASPTAAAQFQLHFESRYRARSGGSGSNVRVRFVDAHEALAGLAAQTCIGTVDKMYHPPKLQSRLELFRVVVLTVQGGLYLEPDHLFTTSLKPLVDIVGEFVVQQPMSQMLSTAVMHLERGSKVGHGMLQLVCKWPQSNDRPVWEPFCKEVRLRTRGYYRTRAHTESQLHAAHGVAM